MEIGSKPRWAAVIGILLIVLIFVGWGLSSIARSVFKQSASNNKAATVKTQEKIELPSLDSVKTARYVVDGPVVASTEHRKYIIEVSSSVVSMRVYSDYGQKVIKENVYENNTQAYDAFMQSLETANATARYVGTGEEDDRAEEGICSNGRRYIIELDKDVRRWTTSCDRSQGTAAGRMTTMRGLFARQIPNFDSLIEDTGLGN